MLIGTHPYWYLSHEKKGILPVLALRGILDFTIQLPYVTDDKDPFSEE